MADSSLPWLTAAPQQSVSWLAVLSLCVVALPGWYFAYAYRIRAMKWQAKAQVWFGRAIIAGWDDTVPSTRRDVEREREYREHWALHSPDHTRLHWCDATNDSEAATEIMQFCVGGLEVEGE